MSDSADTFMSNYNPYENIIASSVHGDVVVWIIEPNHWWHTTSNEWTYRDTNQNVIYCTCYIQYDLVSKLNLWKLSKKHYWNAFIEEMFISFCWKWFYRLDDNRKTIGI